MKTLALTTFALIAFAANSVLCRLALGEATIDAASFSTVRLVSGAAVLVPLAAMAKEPARTASSGDWVSAGALFLYAVPFSFAVAALVTGDLGQHWFRATRRWTLVAWALLGVGILLGGRWAYEVLGWGGYWAWDPVENASLMPWLAATAFLHSVMIQEKRGMLKVWNVAGP